MTDNIILFPGMKRETTPQNVDEIIDQVKQTRKDHVDMVMADMISELIHVFGSYGVDIVDDKYIKDTAMIFEATKSLLHKQYRLDHPFHKMVDKIFEFQYNEDSTIAYTYTLPEEE